MPPPNTVHPSPDAESDANRDANHVRTDAPQDTSNARTSHGTQPTQPAHPPTSPHCYDAGLLILRLVLGLSLATHGTQKLFGWFGGDGLDGTSQFFDSVGYPASATMAVIAGLTETLGGLGLALGLITPLAAAAVFGTMLNILNVSWGDGFFAPEGMEYQALLTAGVATLALAGPGRYAADHYLPILHTHRLRYGTAALVLGALVAGIVLLLKT